MSCSENNLADIILITTIIPVDIAFIKTASIGFNPFLVRTPLEEVGFLHDTGYLEILRQNKYAYKPAEISLCGEYTLRVSFWD